MHARREWSSHCRLAMHVSNHAHTVPSFALEHHRRCKYYKGVETYKGRYPDWDKSIMDIEELGNMGKAN